MSSVIASARKVPHLDDLDQDQEVTEKYYRTRLREHQLQLVAMQRRLLETRRSVVIVMEGPDAAGKGGAIRRLVERLDPRIVRVYSIVKPTDEEYQHNYLWRFWSKLPPYGQMTVFDRSWYGRVLVERVENFATDAEWRRAYREINEFERMLMDDGAVILKLYLHITKDEQLQRFKRREGDPLKHWKISDEDWRNRDKWKAHNQAAEDMFRKTSVPGAPWYLIPANYKWFARLEVLRILTKKFESLKL